MSAARFELDRSLPPPCQAPAPAAPDLVSEGLHPVRLPPAAAAAGGCKLRFVSRSEDVWYSNARKSAKRRAGVQAAASAKRQRFNSWVEQRPRDAQANGLVGLGAPCAAPLPSAHEFRPLEEA